MISKWFALVVAAATMTAVASAATALEDRYFQSADVKIRYVEQGSGEPIVLLHGYTSRLEDWVTNPVFPELAKNYRVIAFDARGHGKSDKPHDPAQYGPEMGQDVLRLMDYLNLRKAHILGYSMGAHIVAQLVTKSPERFVTLIMGGAPGRLEWTPEDQRRVDIEAAEMDQGLLTSQILRLSPKDQPKPSADEIKAISARLFEGQDPKALAAVRRSNPDQAVSLAEMSAIKVPTLGIVGTADPYQKDFEKLKSVLPQMKLVLIQGASHVSAPRRPEFITAVKEFLTEHPAQTN
jgi:pimeloyl-ACP methyl ester carboxylesterase